MIEVSSRPLFGSWQAEGRRPARLNWRQRQRAGILALVLVMVSALVLPSRAVVAETTIGAAIPVGMGPFGVAVNPTTHRVYVANSDSNSVSVIDGATNTVVGSPIAVGTTPIGVGVNSKTNRIYVGNYSSNTVSVIDGVTNTVISSSIQVGSRPFGVGINPAINRVYV